MSGCAVGKIATLEVIVKVVLCIRGLSGSSCTDGVKDGTETDVDCVVCTTNVLLANIAIFGGDCQVVFCANGVGQATLY